VTIDTLRADYLGAYGFAAETSPHLDALAARSVTFERAVAASSRTAPSHATIMTSLHVRQHALGAGNGTTRLADEPTLAEYFREAGYATGAFVGNVTLTRRMGLDRGFQVYDDELPHVELNRPRWFERKGDETTERALAWLAAQTDPVLLWVHFQDPHGPYTPPPPFDRAFHLEAQPGDRPLPVYESQNGFQGLPAYQALEGLTEPRQYRSRYAGEILFVDEWIGKLVAAAEARASERGVVILVTADHGESLGERGHYFTHGSATTPEQIHVPFVLHAPGLSPGRRRELVHHVDVMPTLLELAGLAVPEGVRGVALGRVLRRERAMPERIVYADVGFAVSAYRGERFDRIQLEEKDGRFLPRSWESYAWKTDGSWGAAEPDPGVRPEVSAYLSRIKRPVLAPPLGEEERDRLRALGYLDSRDE
jgi:arylsulfatase A-like enzyme